ncbi:MAG: Ycf66 family protein [Cyanobacteriota bacterium]
MVNFGLNSASILGIFLAVAGAALYFMRSVRPELSRDQDIFFAAVGLLCGFILLFQGWRLDPILQFGQFLLTGTTVFFAYEAIRLRGVATKVVKERTPIVDEERPVSKAYRYEPEEEYYEQIEPEEERYVNRRLRGTATEDPYSSRTEESRRLRSRTSSDRLGAGEQPPKRRTRPTTRPTEPPVERWDAQLDSRDGSEWEDTAARRNRSRPTTRPDSSNQEPSSRPRRRRPPQDRGSTSAYRDTDTSSKGDYVDYQPIDSSEDQSNNPGRFDY